MVYSIIIMHGESRAHSYQSRAVGAGLAHGTADRLLPCLHTIIITAALRTLIDRCHWETLIQAFQYESITSILGLIHLAEGFVLKLSFGNSNIAECAWVVKSNM